MIKPKSLREYLQSKVKSLNDRPDDFLTFIESGQLASTQGPSPSFEYHYKLNLVILDFNDHADVIMVPLLIWIRDNQPDLLTGEPSSGIAFEAEILTNETADISISLNLTERVIVTIEDDVIHTYHCPEPKLEDLSGPINWAMYIGDIIVETTPLLP